jgi:hypothetical protein
MLVTLIPNHFRDNRTNTKSTAPAADDRAHLVGSGEELIHIFAFAMKFAVKAADIRDTVYAFPTSAADIKSMA